MRHINRVFVIVMVIALVMAIASATWAAGAVLARKGFKAGTSGIQSSGNLTLGSDGDPSTAELYPSTANKGTLFIQAVDNNAADVKTTVQNGQAASAAVITLPSATCTLPGIGLANIWSAAQELDSGFTIDDTKLVADGTTGELTGTGPKYYATVPLSATANATVQTGVFVAHRACTITKASVAFVAVPASTLGTATLALTNYDLSATTDDNVLSTATIDLEGLTNKTASDLTLTATGEDLVLADGDYVYATIVSNNADMTGATGGVLTLEYTLQ